MIKLRKIQQDILSFLLTTDRAYLVATCGAGKSLAILKYLEILSDLEGEGASLIVAPKNVVTWTWPNELKKWGYEPPVVLHGSKPWVAQPGRIHLCTYTGLTRLRKDVFKGGRKRPFRRAIFDEVTFAKTPSSSRINSVRGILNTSCERIVGMTGTPIPNRLKDIFAQIRLLDGGERLGTDSKEDFLAPYFRPSGYKGHDWAPREGTLDYITGKISDMSMVLQAKDYDDIKIPEIVEHDVEISIPNAIRAQITELQNELILILQGKHKGDMDTEVVAETAATLSVKCLQLCCGMVISGVDEDREDHWLSDFRVDAVRKVVGKMPSAICLATFKLAQRKLAEALGGVTPKQSRAIERFCNGSERYLVGHYGNLAHGIDGLQGSCDTVAWFSPPWSRDGYDQANARVARPGGSEVCHVYRFYAPGTLEELVLEALRNKAATQEEFVESLRQNIGRLKR